MPKPKSRKKKPPKRVLAPPDLEHVKTAVLDTLTSSTGQRTYDHAIREFVAWYCRIHLEQRGYAPAPSMLAARRAGSHAAAWAAVVKKTRGGDPPCPKSTPR